MTGYTAGFSGLASTGSDGTREIADKIPGAHHYIFHKVFKSKQRLANVEAVAQEIIKLNAKGQLPRPLCAFGHSMGAYTAIRLTQLVAPFGIEFDLLAIIDMTYGPKPEIGGNVKLLQEFHSAYAYAVRGKDFKGRYEPYELDDILGKNIGHSAAAQSDFTQDKIVATIASLTKGKAVSKIPVELSKMVIASGKAINPEFETPEQTKFNQVFFNAIRPTFGAISPAAVDGMKTIINAFDTYIAPKGYDDELLAFVLGNVFNETGKKMVPVRETNADTNAEAIAALNKWWASGKAQKAGVKSQYWLDGYYGRGLFQETHFGNYSKGSVLWEKWFGFPLDFVETPDLFLNPIVSSLSAFIGSIEGKYTGKKFSDYCVDGKCDFAAARAMINGDRNIVLRDVDGDGLLEKMGDEIGDVCEAFLDAINKARGAIYSVPVPTGPATPKPPQIKDMGSLDSMRTTLGEYFPDLNAQNRELVLALAMVLGRSPSPPPEIAQLELPTNPPTEAGFFTPESKGIEMLKTTLNFKSKTTLTGMFAALAGVAMLILPEGNMIVELARSIYPTVDAGTLITNGLAIMFGREAIAKLAK